MKAASPPLFNRRAMASAITSPALIALCVCSITATLNIIYFSGGHFLKTHAYYLGGSIAFATSYWLCRILIKSLDNSILHKRIEKNRKKPSKTLTKISTALGGIGALIALYIITTRGGPEAASMLTNLRYAHTGENMPQYGSAHLALFSLAASVMWLARNNGKMSAFCFLMYTLPSIAVAERTSILFGFIVYFYAGFNTGKISAINLAKFFTATLAAFIAIAIATNKDRIDGAFFLIPYISYGITAFDLSIINNENTGCLSTILGTYAKPFEIAGISLTCDATIYEDPGTFNVYTYMMNPYLWGGWNGLIITMTALGVIYAVAKKMQEQSFYAMMAYSSLLYPIVMMFYAWTFSLTTIFYWVSLCTIISIAHRARIR